MLIDRLLLEIALLLWYYLGVKKRSFNRILAILSRQKGEDKLRIAFELSQLVRDIRAEGALYVKKKTASRARATA